MKKSPSMLISDSEIPAEHIPMLDADPATRAYEPYYNGKRYRPAVEKKITEREAQR